MVRVENNCSLWILVARTDAAFMMQTIPHLVRMCGYPFAEKVLAVDTAPLSGEKALRQDVGTMDELRLHCKELLNRGIIDRVIDIDYSNEYRKKAYRRHFGRANIRATHNWKGYPILGSIFCIEECKTDYFLHFDSDMLLYQEPGFNWIGKGVNILQNHPDIMFVRPQAGPQSEDMNIYKDDYHVRADPGGFYKLSGFASRCFFIDRKRFEKLLPMKALWAKKQGRIIDRFPRTPMEVYHNFTGEGLLESWEVMVAKGVQDKGFMRADIGANKCWTLHPPDHGEIFVKALPRIIERIEKGEFPAQQAGNYDLDLKFWI